LTHGEKREMEECCKSRGIEPVPAESSGRNLLAVVIHGVMILGSLQVQP
jgi:hypothetical protein